MSTNSEIPIVTWIILILISATILPSSPSPPITTTPKLSKHLLNIIPIVHHITIQVLNLDLPMLIKVVM